VCAYLCVIRLISAPVSKIICVGDAVDESEGDDEIFEKNFAGGPRPRGSKRGGVIVGSNQTT